MNERLRRHPHFLPQMLSVVLGCLLASTAAAVPSQMATQGRFLDANGAPVNGPVEVTFRLMDSDVGGGAVWSETQSLSVVNGFYTALLGADELGNPLDNEMLDQWPLWLEVEITGQAPMEPRMEVGSCLLYTSDAADE